MGLPAAATGPIGWRRTETPAAPSTSCMSRRARSEHRQRRPDHRTTTPDPSDDGRTRQRARPFENRTTRMSATWMDDPRREDLPRTSGLATRIGPWSMPSSAATGMPFAPSWSARRRSSSPSAGASSRIRSDAEDAAQDAFLIAYRKIGTFRGDGPLGGWLMRIAVREARDRAMRRRPATSLDHDRGEALDAATARAVDDPLAVGRAARAARLDPGGDRRPPGAVPRRRHAALRRRAVVRGDRRGDRSTRRRRSAPISIAACIACASAWPRRRDA